MDNKNTCVQRLSHLAEVFSGDKFLDGVETNERLKTWFKETSVHVSTLQQEDARIIAALVQALEEVQGTRRKTEIYRPLRNNDFKDEIQFGVSVTC